MTATTIRLATIDDARRIAELHVLSWRAAYARILPQHSLVELTVPKLERQWRQSLARGHRPEAVYVIEETPRSPVGFATITASPRDRSLLGLAGEVQMLYLHPASIGRGLGRELFARTLEAMAGAGLHWVVVWVLALNGRARRFYERAGLREDGATRTDWFGDEPFRVVRYAAALNPVVDFHAIAREVSASR